MASSVENLTAFAFPVFNMERFAVVIPIFKYYIYLSTTIFLVIERVPFLTFNKYIAD
jgi:hypothetical protein